MAAAVNAAAKKWCGLLAVLLCCCFGATASTGLAIPDIGAASTMQPRQASPQIVTNPTDMQALHDLHTTWAAHTINIAQLLRGWNSADKNRSVCKNNWAGFLAPTARGGSISRCWMLTS